jgi:hypothetical protein
MSMCSIGLGRVHAGLVRVFTCVRARMHSLAQAQISLHHVDTHTHTHTQAHTKAHTQAHTQATERERERETTQAGRFRVQEAQNAHPDSLRH